MAAARRSSTESLVSSLIHTIGKALKAAIRRALRRPRQIPDGLGFFSYEKFRERLQDIIGGLRVESASAA
jgi:hypothetical protein